MGFFSRKDKSNNHKARPGLETSNSNTSLHSGSSIKSPAPTSSFSRTYRTSAGTGTSSIPGTPLTPFSPAHSMAAKIDIPRPPDPQLDPVGYLRSLNAVRERCSIVTEKAVRNDLHHFDVDMGKFPDVVTFVANIIKVRRTNSYDCPGLTHAQKKLILTHATHSRETMTHPSRASPHMAGTSISRSVAVTG